MPTTILVCGKDSIPSLHATISLFYILYIVLFFFHQYFWVNIIKFGQVTNRDGSFWKPIVSFCKQETIVNDLSKRKYIGQKIRGQKTLKLIVKQLRFICKIFSKIIVFYKTLVLRLKNDRFAFFESSKWVVRFQKLSFLERKRKRKTIVFSIDFKNMYYWSILFI